MITSSSNERIKKVVQLNAKARARREAGCFIAEGYRIYCETPAALRRAVFVSESFAAHRPDIAEESCAEIVSDGVFRKMCDTKTPQGILTVAAMPAWDPEDLLDGGAARPGMQGCPGSAEPASKPLILLLENLQDPGNVGTIIRTAEGAGATGIVVGSETADVFSPKVIRATMGSVFRVPVIRTSDLPGMVRWMSGRGIQSYAAHLEGSIAYTETDLADGALLMIGNEGNGLTEELTRLADHRIHIPMSGLVESLNAAVAAAILMYEARRQRSRA